MISEPLKIEIKELLSNEYFIVNDILKNTEDIERRIRKGETKEIEETLKRSLEEGEKVEKIEKVLKDLLDSNNISIDDLKKIFEKEVMEISDCLSKIMEINKNINNLINKKKDRILDNLKKLQIGKRIHGRYLRNLKGSNGSINILE